MKKFGVTVMKAVYEKNKWLWSDFNIFGIRTARNGDKVSNRFDDAIGIAYFESRLRQWEYVQFDATTEAGLTYHLQPMRASGTAILKEGFYPNAYRLGKHRGIYDALVQVNPMEFYRDGNRDGVFDIAGDTERAVIGANIHRAHDNQTVKNVGAYSAACQVIQRPTDFDEFMRIVKAEVLLRNRVFFDYALTHIDTVEEVYQTLFGKKEEKVPREDILLGEPSKPMKEKKK